MEPLNACQSNAVLRQFKHLDPAGAAGNAAAISALFRCYVKLG